MLRILYIRYSSGVHHIIYISQEFEGGIYPFVHLEVELQLKFLVVFRVSDPPLLVWYMENILIHMYMLR